MPRVATQIRNEELADHDPVLPPYALALREMRARKGVSLVVAAKGIGISKTYLWQLEGAQCENPTRDTCAKLANYYGTDITPLLGDLDAAPVDLLTDAGLVRLANRLTARQRQHVGALMLSLAEANEAARDVARALLNNHG